MRPEVGRLLKQADRDLENVRKNIGIQAYEVAAFLAQHGDGLGVPANLRRHLADLTSDYTVSRYPDAANAVPYEIYDESTARSKVENAEAVITWLRSKIGS
jgi:HEPN domain-containing protein